MDTVLFILFCSINSVVGVMLQRLFQGPTVWDRMNALGVIGAHIIMAIIVLDFMDNGHGDMFLDIAISYAMLGFIGSVIIAKFLGGKKI